MTLLKRAFKNLTAAKLWYFSCRAYRSGNVPLAVFLKTINFFVYKALLPYQCEIESDLTLVHNGFGMAVHPNVTLGKNVTLLHHVTLAAETAIGSPSRIVVEDGCVIGAYAIIVGNDHGGIRIGTGSIVGMGAIVSQNVAPGTTLVAPPARAVKPNKVYADGLG